MDLLFATLIIIPVLGPTLIWLFAIRPYCRSNGQGYTPGAEWGITTWVDWQHASEISVRRRDRWMIWFCRVFLIWSILLISLKLLLFLLSAIVSAV
jgi:hypothetical protein